MSIPRTFEIKNRRERTRVQDVVDLYWVDDDGIADFVSTVILPKEAADTLVDMMVAHTVSRVPRTR